MLYIVKALDGMPYMVTLSYYNDMKLFLENDCTLVNEFSDKTYGMRIARYINEKEWTIKIYKVKY